MLTNKLRLSYGKNKCWKMTLVPFLLVDENGFTKKSKDRFTEHWWLFEKLFIFQNSIGASYRFCIKFCKINALFCYCTYKCALFSRIFFDEEISRLSTLRLTVWKLRKFSLTAVRKLRKFTLTLFWQKFRGSNIFTR